MMIMTAIKLAQRMGQLGTESAFEVLARAKAMEAAGTKVIHLEIGEPDFPTADHIVTAAIDALRAGHTHYVPAPGIPQLRETVAAFLDRTGRLRADPDRVIVTPGAKPIMFFTIMALCGPGDEVLYPDPGFPMYESITAFAGATPVPLPLREADGFRVNIEELKTLISKRTKLLVLNTPHNPCGSALTEADCAAIAEIALERDLIVLTDEVYWALRYGAGRPASVLDVPGMADRTILLDGWSKTYAMTGWRLGFGVFPPALVEPVTRLAINSVSCTSAFSQYAAIAALDGPQDPVADMLAEFRRRRDVIVSGLNDIPGVSCVEPDGAFYAFPNITGTGLSSAELARRLLDDAGVAVLPGTAFGRHGEGYLRFSYANSVENIQAALEAMRGVLLPGLRVCDKPGRRAAGLVDAVLQPLGDDGPRARGRRQRDRERAGRGRADGRGGGAGADPAGVLQHERDLLLGGGVHAGQRALELELAVVRADARLDRLSGRVAIGEWRRVDGAAGPGDRRRRGAGGCRRRRGRVRGARAAA